MSIVIVYQRSCLSPPQSGLSGCGCTSRA